MVTLARPDSTLTDEGLARIAAARGVRREDANLRRLDNAVAMGLHIETIRRIHDDLMAQLRTNTPTPKWDDYPTGRQFFLQVWP